MSDAGVALLIPDWPAPPNVKTFVTLKNAQGPSGQDEVELQLRSTGLLPAAPFWLHQVHGSAVASHLDATMPDADAAVTDVPLRPLVVQTADCLPVLFCDVQGARVGVAHAGWRGLAAGVLEATVAQMREGSPDLALMAWMGPAIGPAAFEVGEDVFAAFVSHDPQACDAFKPLRRDANGRDKYLCDLAQLARQRLHRVGVSEVYGGQYCTVSDPHRFHSYRRDGRIVDHLRSFIWRLA